MKDVETIRPEEIVIAAMLPRADVQDRLIGAKSVAALPKGGKVGTSSPRRAAKLLQLRPDLSIVLFRGNVAHQFLRGRSTRPVTPLWSTSPLPAERTVRSPRAPSTSMSPEPIEPTVMLPPIFSRSRSPEPTEPTSTGPCVERIDTSPEPTLPTLDAPRTLRMAASPEPTDPRDRKSTRLNSRH